MKILGPISARKNDHRVLKLVRNGQATDDELFEAQYGEWPPRGLNKDITCPDVVHFKGYLKDKKFNPMLYLFSYGYIRKESEQRDIFLNSLLLSPLAPIVGILSTRMAFPRIHDLVEVMIGIRMGPYVEMLAASLFSSYRYAAISSVMKLGAPSISDIVGEEHIHTKKLKDGYAVSAQNAFQIASRDFINNQGPLERNWIELKQTVDMLLTLMPRAYFARDTELQARMHNIMVRGYPAWGRIPQTKDELYAALQDMGIITPSSIRNRSMPTEARTELNHIFNKHIAQGYLAAPAAEMNIGLNSSRSPQVLEQGWKDILPALYGDLLRQYGDTQGMQRMGYTDEDDVLGLPIAQP